MNPPNKRLSMLLKPKIPCSFPVFSIKKSTNYQITKKTHTKTADGKQSANKTVNNQQQHKPNQLPNQPNDI